MTTDLIIGAGEVGVALGEVLGERQRIAFHDPPKGIVAKSEDVSWLHVCIPWSDNVITFIAEYAREFQPKHIIIHGTMKVGTTRQVQRECDYIPTYYSPVRGRHPHLARYLREFPKYYATDIPGQADNEIEEYYANAGMQSRRAPSLEVLELMKVWETSSFALQLVMWMEIENEMKQLPGIKSVNLSAMKSWLFEKRRCYDGDIGLVPVLDVAPGPLGGHCLESNILLAQDLFHPALFEWLTSVNDARKEK